MAEIDAAKAYKVAVVGDRDSVLGFMALGYHVCIVPDAESAGEEILRLAADGSYAVIFITEGYAVSLGDIIGKFKNSPLPAIVTIPSADGSGKGFGMDNLKRSVERAVGADILS